MSNSILADLPDISRLTSLNTSLDGIKALTAGLDGLAGPIFSGGQAGADSPLAQVAETFAKLSDVLDVDVSGFSTRLPATFRALQNALPANTIAYVNSIQSAYQQAQDLMANNNLTRAIPEGKSLQEIVLAGIAEAGQILSKQVKELTDKLVDPQSLAAVEAVRKALSDFESDYANHPNDLLPFLSNNLLGVPPDLLGAPLAHVQAVFDAGAQLGSLSLTLTPARQTLDAALDDLVAAVRGLDPSNPVGYTAIQSALTALESATVGAFNILDPVYPQLKALVTARQWATFFNTYTTLLDKINLLNSPSANDLVAQLVELLDGLLARIAALFDPRGLSERLNLLNQTIRDAFLGSALGQVRKTLDDFLGKINAAIADIPIEAVFQAVETMLGRVTDEFQALDITQVCETISDRFQAVDTFVTGQIGASLVGNVQAQFEQLLNGIERLPVTDLMTELGGLVQQLAALVERLKEGAQEQIEALNGSLDQLEGVSYKPGSDKVIEQINAIQTRLNAIQPDALSDAEKLALRGALAGLSAIRLEEDLVKGIKGQYHDIEKQVKAYLDQVTAALQALSLRFEGYSPQNLLQPVNNLLGQAGSQVDQINAQRLFAELYELLDHLRAALDAISPERLLAPLQSVYASINATFNLLTPDHLVAPLEAVYQKITQLIDVIDLTPALDALLQMQSDLAAQIRAAISAITLPDPLQGLLDQLKPIMAGLTDAIFSAPDVELKKVSLDLPRQVTLSSLFTPLDALFERLVNLLQQVPADDLTGAMNALRQSVGIGLQMLDPLSILNQMEACTQRLRELAPGQIFARVMYLDEIQSAFNAAVSPAPVERQADIAAVQAQFERVLGGIISQAAGSPLATLILAHQDALQTLQDQFTVPDVSAARRSYARLQTNLGRRLPDFLLNPTPLSHAQVLAGVETLRPSNHIALLDQTWAYFSARIQPVATTLDADFNRLFTTLRDMIEQISPLALRDGVSTLMVSLRSQVGQIDPGQLRSRLDPIFYAARRLLDNIDPNLLCEQVRLTYENAVATLTHQVKSFLDAVSEVVAAKLLALRDALKEQMEQITPQAASLSEQMQAITSNLKGLILVDVLARLSRVIDSLGLDFDKELDRVCVAFNAMLRAIPLEDRGGGTAPVTT